MKRPLLILVGSLILAYGIAFERAGTYEHDIRTISKTIYGDAIDSKLQYVDGGAGEYSLALKQPSFQTHPVGEHGQLSEHSKHKIALYFWEWFAGTFIVSVIVLGSISEGDKHE